MRPRDSSFAGDAWANQLSGTVMFLKPRSVECRQIAVTGRAQYAARTLRVRCIVPGAEA